MKNIVILSLVLVHIVLICGCNPVNPNDISRITISFPGGQSRVELELNRKGESKLSCIARGIKSNDPVREVFFFDPLCRKLLENRAAFIRSPNSPTSFPYDLHGHFKSRLKSDHFDRLAKLITEKDYFSLSDSYFDAGILDSMPPTIEVWYRGNVKKVRLGEAERTPPNLDTITAALVDTTKALDWEQDKNVKVAVKKDYTNFFEKLPYNLLENIEEKVGGEFKSLRFAVYKNYMKFKLQDPSEPQRFYVYTFLNDKLSKPRSTELGQSEQRELQQSLFSLNEVKFSKIPNLVTEALKRSDKFEDPKVSHVLVDKSQLNFRSPVHIVRIRVFVSGESGRGTLLADKDGKIVDFKIDPSYQNN